MDPNTICRFFNFALLKSQYTYDWRCPNGKYCYQRHFISKEHPLILKKKTFDVEKLQKTIKSIRYELVEKNQLTPINSKTFFIWKKLMERGKKKFFNQEIQKKVNIHLFLHDDFIKESMSIDTKLIDQQNIIKEVENIHIFSPFKEIEPIKN